MEKDTDDWIRDGLRFSCTQCGGCCTGSPGYVWVTDEEIKNIAAYISMELQQFQRKYIRFVYGRKALVEMKKNFDCIFLQDNKCSVYMVRPRQCRTFPWWQQNLSSPEAWKAAAQYCEGISDNAPIVPYEEIQKQLGTVS